MSGASGNDWEVLDEQAVAAALDRRGAAEIAGALDGDTPTPADRAKTLCDLAVAGNVARLKRETETFRAWAEGLGLRRLTNALVELDRVAGMPERGAAILQAQALTRFIALHVADDVKRLKKALAAR